MFFGDRKHDRVPLVWGEALDGNGVLGGAFAGGSPVSLVECTWLLVLDTRAPELQCALNL
jgi:hypothetical protein